MSADHHPPVSPRPWSVPVAVDEVPETGRHVELAAEPETRAAIAGLAGVVSVPRLSAEFELTRHGHGACACGDWCRRRSIRPAS